MLFICALVMLLIEFFGRKDLTDFQDFFHDFFLIKNG